MKNFSLMFALSVVALTASGFAEGHGGGGGGHEGGGGHAGSSHAGSGHGSSAGHAGSSHGGSGHGHNAGHGHGGQRSHAHREARSHYRHGRFDRHYYGSHFGRGYPIVWGGAGFWFGAAWASPFWFGGVYWGFGPGVVFLPEWQVGGWYIGSVPSGYVLLNPAFPTVQVPVVVNINMAPPADNDDTDNADQDQEDESDE